MPAHIRTACSRPRKCGDAMYSNPASSLAAGSVSATGAITASGGGDAFWVVLGGFAILAATTAVWRIVPREEK